MRANRLKYSIAGENASIAAVNIAPSVPSLLRNSSGIRISALPAMAYSSREV